MASLFGGIVLITEAGGVVADPIVQGRARCLLLLECCARYMADLAPLTADQPERHARIQTLTNLLAINILEVTRTDASQLFRDIKSLAELLDIEMDVVQVPTCEPAKGVN